MTCETGSEKLFELFCRQNQLDWEAIPTGPRRAPDYRLRFKDRTVLVEIKQIESQAGFNPGGVSSRTVGSHVRHKIQKAGKQLKAANDDGLPAILLIHNAIDPLQAFGTESHDFICAMYGELTVRLTKGQSDGSLHGRNAKLRHEVNTSISGIGHLRRTLDGAEITVFENVYADFSLPFDVFPPCIEVVRVEVDHSA